MWIKIGSGSCISMRCDNDRQWRIPEFWGVEDEQKKKTNERPNKQQTNKNKKNEDVKWKWCTRMVFRMRSICGSRWAFAISKWKYIYYYGEQTHKKPTLNLLASLTFSVFERYELVVKSLSTGNDRLSTCKKNEKKTYTLNPSF